MIPIPYFPLTCGSFSHVLYIHNSYVHVHARRVRIHVCCGRYICIWTCFELQCVWSIFGVFENVCDHSIANNNNRELYNLGHKSGVKQKAEINSAIETFILYYCSYSLISLRYVSQYTATSLEIAHLLQLARPKGYKVGAIQAR